MKRLYLALTAIIVGLLSLTGYFYLIVLENEINSQANLMVNQITICGNNLRQGAELLEHDLRYIVNSEKWETIFNESQNDNLYKTRIRRFYSRFDELIDSIHFHNETTEISAYISDQNYYTLKNRKFETPEYLQQKRIIFLDSSTTSLIIPIQNASGNVIANVRTFLNISSFVKNEFRNYYIGPHTWEMILIPGKGVSEYIYSEQTSNMGAPEFSPDHLMFMSNQIQAGLQGITENEILFNNEYHKLISVYSPLRLYNHNFGLVFSASKDELLTSVITYFVIIALLSASVIAIIIVVFVRMIKERNQANEILEENRTELTNLVNQQELLLTHSDDFVYRFDLKGNINYVTDSVEAVMGYTSDEFMSNIKEFITQEPENIKILNDSFNEIKQGNIPEGFVITAINNFDEQIVLEIHAQPVTNDEGKIIGAIGIAKDITEIHEAERLLEESRQRLHFISENMKDMICLHDPAGNFTYISPSVTDILGYEPEDLLGKNPYRDFEITDLRYIKGSPYGRILNHKVENLVQYRARKNDGEYVWIESLTQPFMDEFGNLTSMLSASRDISDRMEAQVALKQSEMRFRSLFEEAAIGIAQIDTNWKCVNVNHQLQKMLEYDKIELVDRNFKELINLDFDSNDLLEHNKLINGSIKSYKIEKQLSRKSENILWGRITLSLVQNDLRNPAFYILMIEDITEKRKHESEMKQAMAAAESGSRAKSEFLATMSHEIRTPMNGVIGMTSLLSETELSKEQAEYVNIIRTSGEALLELINDILDYSKIEAGRMDLEEAPFAINQSVEEAIDLCAQSAEKKGVELAYLIDSDVPEVIQGDISRLRQVLVNLISNAIKFTVYGEVFVQVSLIDRIEDNAKLQIRVKDTGIGIPSDKIGNLFQAFSQIDSSTTRKFGGTGLGLAICKRIVSLMNGDIWVESEENKGSSFYFTIRTNVVSDKIIKDYNYELLRNKRILIVDDNHTNLKIFTTITEKWGLTPKAYDSGVKAITGVLNGEVYDAVIMDMQMPEMNGIEVAKKIKSLVKYNIPVIFITSFSFSEEEKKDVENYFSAQLTKPIKQSQLFEALYYIFYTEPKKLLHDENSNMDSNSQFAEILPLRILAAEDNPVNQKFIIHVLKKLGYTAEVAGNGKEVIELVEKRPYDLIFMDIQMPIMDGLEATEVILKRWPDDRPKIIALTANALKEDRDRCLEKGMDDYMSKPVTLNKIKDILQKHAESMKANTNKGDLISEPGSEKPEDELLDMEVLREYLQNDEDKEFFRDVVEMSYENIKENLNDLKDSLEDGKYVPLAKLAHTMKGLSYNVGAKKLGELAKEMQNYANEENSWEISKSLSKFSKSLDVSFDKIRTLLG